MLVVLPKSDRGNKYILVAIYYFSKWPEVYALPNQEAETVAKVLFENWVCRYAVPLQLHSDQGKNLELKLFQPCRLLGVMKTRMMALHPQLDSVVERFNRTLKKYLAKNGVQPSA